MLQEFTSEVEKTAKSVVNEIHTALPGEIVSFDGNVAAVKPLGNFITSDGAILEYPVITEAPVCFPQCTSGNVSICFPLKAGDSCLIIISEVELDAWRSGAKAEGSLRFDLTSGIVIPGLQKGMSETAKKAISENAVVVSNGSTTLKVKPNGVFIEGSLNVTGDVRSGGISLKGHTHTDSEGGSTSTAR